MQNQQEEQDPVCKGCQQSIGEGNVIAFGESVWHIQCFKCHKCNRPLNQDSPDQQALSSGQTQSLLLLSDGSPICEQCCYQCAACGQSISDEAIMTGDDAYHEQCFKCAQCQKPIEDLVFAKSPTQDGNRLVCMNCHNNTQSSQSYGASAASVGRGQSEAERQLQLTAQKLADTERVLEKLKAVSKGALEEFNKTKDSWLAEKTLREKNERAVHLLKQELERLRKKEVQLNQENKQLMLSGSNLALNTAGKPAAEQDVANQLEQRAKDLRDEVQLLEAKKQSLQLSASKLGEQRNKLVQELNAMMQNMGMDQTHQQHLNVSTGSGNRSSTASDVDVMKIQTQFDSIKDSFQLEIQAMETERAQLIKDIDQNRQQKVNLERFVSDLKEQKGVLIAEIQLLRQKDAVATSPVVGGINKPVPPIRNQNSGADDVAPAPVKLSAKDSKVQSVDNLSLGKSKQLPAVGGVGSAASSSLQSPVSPVSPASEYSQSGATQSDQGKRQQQPLQGGRSLKDLPAVSDRNQSMEASMNSASLLEAQLREASQSDLRKQANRVTIMKKTKASGANKRPHNFQNQSFLVPSKCMVCAEKLWQVKSKDFMCKNCGQACHAKCIQSTSADCQPASHSKGAPQPPVSLFGLDLDALTSLEGRMVPSVVEKSIMGIEARGLESEGIYRKSGLQSQVKQLMDEFNSSKQFGSDLDLRNDDRFPDINVVSSILKQYFRQLPSPLLSFEYYGYFIAAAINSDPAEKFISMAEAISALPDPNYETLRYLMMHLNKVSSRSAVNLMHARNLAVVFGPNLLKSPAEKAAGQNGTVDAAAELADMGHKNSVVEYLVENCQNLFVASAMRRQDPTANLLQFYNETFNATPQQQLPNQIEDTSQYGQQDQSQLNRPSSPSKFKSQSMQEPQQRQRGTSAVAEMIHSNMLDKTQTLNSTSAGTTPQGNDLYQNNYLLVVDEEAASMPNARSQLQQQKSTTQSSKKLANNNEAPQSGFETPVEVEKSVDSIAAQFNKNNNASSQKDLSNNNNNNNKSEDEKYQEFAQSFLTRLKGNNIKNSGPQIQRTDTETIPGPR